MFVLSNSTGNNKVSKKNLCIRTVLMKFIRLEPLCSARSSLQLTFERKISDECWSVCKPIAKTNTAS